MLPAITVAVSLLAGTGWAMPDATLRGSVVNQDQEPVSGCAVSLTMAGKNTMTVEGRFEFDDLPLAVQRPYTSHAGSWLKGSRLYFTQTLSAGPVNINIFDLQGRQTAAIFNTPAFRERGLFYTCPHQQI
jgi:hypothetical protein